VLAERAQLAAVKDRSFKQAVTNPSRGGLLAAAARAEAAAKKAAEKKAAEERAALHRSVDPVRQACLGLAPGKMIRSA